MNITTMNSLTPWFDGTVKPERVGIYERDTYAGVLFSQWTGTQWLKGARSIHLAEKQTDVSRKQDAFPWRGLAADPQQA